MKEELEKIIAQKLAKSGEEFNMSIGDNQKQYLQTFHNRDSFLIAIANALTWTGHAIDDIDFFEPVISFLITSDMDILPRIRKFAGRLGEKGLFSALQSWKAIIDLIGKQNTLSVDAKGLYSIQKRSLDTAYLLIRQNQISGLGPWLFCAPFKIIAALRNDLWRSEDLDALLMPLGKQVIRGIKILIKNRYSYVHGINENELAEEEGGLIEGMGTVSSVQSVCKKFAKDTQSRVLHINSGLFLYGKGEL